MWQSPIFNHVLERCKNVLKESWRTIFQIAYYVWRSTIAIKVCNNKRSHLWIKATKTTWSKNNKGKHVWMCKGLVCFTFIYSKGVGVILPLHMEGELELLHTLFRKEEFLKKNVSPSHNCKISLVVKQPMVKQ